MSFGQPTGGCEGDDGPPEKSSVCYLPATPGGRPADEAAFLRECGGQKSCTLLVESETFGGMDPCMGQNKWLLVVAECDYTDTLEPLSAYVECRDEFVHVPRLGAAGLPPLLGRIDLSADSPGTGNDQYPLTRFDGTWDNMDDFLSR